MMTKTRNQVAALAGLPNMFQQLATSPVRRWQQAGIGHKAIMIGAGVAAAYLLHRSGADDLVAAAAGVGTAYGSSMLMHYPAVSNATVVAPANNSVPALPSAPMQQRVDQAQHVLQSMGPVSSGLPISSIGRAPKSGIPTSTLNGDQDLLNLEM
jgi:hypothetical protein